MSATDYTIEVGPPARDHRWEIADAVACHDIPGMPSLAELTDDQQAAYLDFADQVLDMPFDTRGVGDTDTAKVWFCRSLFGEKCTPLENDGRDHDQCGWRDE